MDHLQGVGVPIYEVIGFFLFTLWWKSVVAACSDSVGYVVPGWSGRCLPFYAWVYQAVSFPQVSPPKPCIGLSSPHTRYMHRPPNHSRFYHRNINNSILKEQKLKFTIKPRKLSLVAVQYKCISNCVRRFWMVVMMNTQRHVAVSVRHCAFCSVKRDMLTAICNAFDVTSSRHLLLAPGSIVAYPIMISVA